MIRADVANTHFQASIVHSPSGGAGEPQGKVLLEQPREDPIHPGTGLQLKDMLNCGLHLYRGGKSLILLTTGSGFTSWFCFELWAEGEALKV